MKGWREGKAGSEEWEPCFRRCPIGRRDSAAPGRKDCGAAAAAVGDDDDVAAAVAVGGVDRSGDHLNRLQSYQAESRIPE